MADTYDLIVLGSGPGGYVAAIRAAQLGLKTAIVERELLGGICLNWGCIPTKALLRSAEIFHYMTARHGLRPERREDRASTSRRSSTRSRKVAKQLNKGVKGLMKKNKIAVVEGDGDADRQGQAQRHQGRREDRARRQAHHHRHRRPRARPAVRQGRRQADLDLSPRDGAPEMPTKLLVIGSGAIGIEFASFYRDMGAEVTVVEMLDRDRCRSRTTTSPPSLDKALTKQGMTIHVGAGVEKLKAGQRASRRRSRARTARSTSDEFSHAIVAVGIVPNTENIGLEALGVKTDRGHIVTDRLWPHQCRGHLRDRRRHRPALAGAQGEPRGRHLRRGDRRRQQAVHPFDDLEHPRLHLLPPAGRQRRPDRGQGEGSGPQGQGRQLPLHRQRQGDRARRGRRLRQDRVRRQDRRAARRPHDRRRGDRADPGLYHRAGSSRPPRPS